MFPKPKKNRKSKGNKTVKFHPENGCCLCSGHHIFWAHKKPEEFRDWLIATRGQDNYEKLKIMAYSTSGKVDLEGIRILLTKDVENAKRNFIDNIN